MQILVCIILIIGSVGTQGYPPIYEPVRKHSEFSHVKSALEYLIKYEKGLRRKRYNFYVVVDAREKQAFVYWKEKETIYLWIPKLGIPPETDIALAKRRWNSKRDVCPPAQCAFGNNYMIPRKYYLEMLRDCLKHVTHYAVTANF
ncbi:MAG: hypothetical protein IPO77_16960 [Acidobacteria bacterium]|nr:hypothetical protein [Acidobacteriota bacterium]